MCRGLFRYGFRNGFKHNRFFLHALRVRIKTWADMVPWVSKASWVGRVGWDVGGYGGEPRVSAWVSGWVELVTGVRFWVWVDGCGALENVLIGGLGVMRGIDCSSQHKKRIFHSAKKARGHIVPVSDCCSLGGDAVR